jgi:hypothetical protein
MILRQSAAGLQNPMAKRVLWASIALTFFSSCATFNSTAATIAAVFTPEQPVKLETAPVVWAYEPVSLTEQRDTCCWVCRPSSTGLVVIGVANRQSKPEAEIEGAKDDAARKVAMYHGIHGKVTTVLDVGSGLLDFSADTAIELAYDLELEKYRSALQYKPETDILVDNSVVYVRFDYAANVDTFSYNDKLIDGAPGWIKKPPIEISGYMAAVGFAKNQSRFKDTIAKSYENAAASLISRLSARVETREADDSSTGSVSETLQISEGAVTNFLALEIWVDPKSKSVWTLAVANPL